MVILIKPYPALPCKLFVRYLVSRYIIARSNIPVLDDLGTASSSILIPDLPNLGAGEREVLSLATTIPDSLVILDDGMARSYAQQLNISVTGTLGVLLKGKQSGYVEAIAPLLDQLNALNFRLAPATRAAVLKLVNEWAWDRTDVELDIESYPNS